MIDPLQHKIISHSYQWNKQTGPTKSSLANTLSRTESFLPLSLVSVVIHWMVSPLMLSVSITARDRVLVLCLLNALPGVNVERHSQELPICSISNIWKGGKRLLMPFIKKDLISLSKFSTVEDPASLKLHEVSSPKHHLLSPSETCTSFSEKTTKFQKKWLLMTLKPPKKNSEIQFNLPKKLALMESNFMVLMDTWLMSFWSHGATREPISMEVLPKTDADLPLSLLILPSKCSSHGKLESKSHHALDTMISMTTTQPKLTSNWLKNSIKEKSVSSKLDSQLNQSQTDTNSQLYLKNKFQTFANFWGLISKGW